MSTVVTAAARSQAARLPPPQHSAQQQRVPCGVSAGRPRISSCRQIKTIARAARADDEVEAVPPAMLSRLDSEEELQEEAGWVASMVECWLNEEWPAQELLDVHADLGAATGQAYLRLRQQEGIEEMGDLVLSLSTEMMTAFDFHPTFTSAFEVSNKVVELLMLRGGCDVCCTTDSDRTAIQRYESQLAADAARRQ